MPEAATKLAVREPSEQARVIDIKGDITAASEDVLMEAYGRASGDGVRAIVLSFAGLAAALMTAFLALVLAPITEELFYRGIFYRSLRDRHGVLVGAVVSALLFGASHVVDAPWRDVVFLQTLMVFTGAGLALIYERRANLVADIAAHTAFND